MAKAISATVHGDDQKVGFRALIMKQAIEYNLAGIARNEGDEIVKFTLQGDPDRLDSALATIREGTPKSSNIALETTSLPFDPALNTFTIVDWTSNSRNIKDPYTLVFKARADGSEVSESEAKSVWRQILRSTLKSEDLRKLGDDD
jgi:acylphosphatase